MKPSSSEFVYELLSEVKRDSRLDEEWMYTLKNQEQGSDEFAEALDCFFAGQFSQALTHLETHFKSNADDEAAAALVARARIEAPSAVASDVLCLTEVTEAPEDSPEIAELADGVWYARRWCGWDPEGTWEASVVPRLSC
eukprot:RCo040551